MPMNEKPFSPEEGGVRLVVRVTPRAKRNCVAGIVRDANGEPALAVRLAAPPVDGAANTALCGFIAELAGIGRSKVSIRAGETGRRKILQLSGADAEIVRRLEAAISG